MQSIDGFAEREREEDRFWLVRNSIDRRSGSADTLAAANTRAFARFKVNIPAGRETLINFLGEIRLCQWLVYVAAAALSKRNTDFALVRINNTFS